MAREESLLTARRYETVTTAAAALAGTVVGAMYLDAKLLIRHDMTSGALASVSTAALDYTTQRVKEDRMTTYDTLHTHAESPATAQNVFLIFEGRTWTYQQFRDDIRRVANWLMNDLDVKRGEMVALDGGNSPEFLMIQMAIDGIGASWALINCNLTAKPLVHCVTVCDARLLITDAAVRSLVQPHEEELKNRGCRVVYYDEEMISKQTDIRPIPVERTTKLAPEGIAGLIYTSGTTGMPKGMKLMRMRWLNVGRGTALYLGLKPGMRMYSCLPLYHASALGLCINPIIYAGATVVLSRKFSHTKFWPEVRDSKADIIQYVGELCRYLVNAPPSPMDKNHSVTMAWGNGMRPDVWDVFRNRFGIECINELYAATDGMGGSFNNNRGEFGKYAIGKRGFIWHYLNSKNEKRVKIDSVTQEIVRDVRGFAIECKAGEAGETVHRLFPDTEKTVFTGYYNNDDATEKRKIRNLFEKGDKWFRSGDMMRQEADGTVFFVDRLGDTFRWKSENVSTSEVGDTIGHFPAIAEANVYGVQVPHADGRCGCAAVVLREGYDEKSLDLAKLADHNIKSLPRYAVPVFIRVVKQIEYTGTMKMQKGKVREEGINLDKMSADGSKDLMYWLPPGKSVYVPFAMKDLETLRAGAVKL